MPEDLGPDIIGNLTDTQKTNIKIIQNITSLNTALNDLQHDVSIHDKILVTGNGGIPLPERIRNLEAFTDSIKFWLRTVAVAIVLQTLSFSIAIVIAMIRFLPILEKLANGQP